MGDRLDTMKVSTRKNDHGTTAAKAGLYHDLMNDLASTLEWNEEEVHIAVELFSARPRESLADPPPFSRKNVEP